MGFVLDSILLKQLIETPTTVNTDFTSESVDLTFREQDFAIQFTYDNGTNVNMTLYLEVSNDDVNYARITDSAQIITDPDGTHIWSLGGEGASYLRVGVEITTGSIDIQSIQVNMKRRH